MVETDAGRFESRVLVNCAGAWADRIAADLGEPVPMQAIAPMLTVTTRMRPVMRHVIGATDRVLSIKQMENGSVIIGGGYRGRADRDAETTVLDYAKLGWNVKIAADFFPALREARVLRCWAGIEARTEDGLPVIGASGTEQDAFHAFGFSAHGFHLGPAVGAVLAELVTGGASNVPIEAFGIQRFRQPAAERQSRHPRRGVRRRASGSRRAAQQQREQVQHHQYPDLSGTCPGITRRLDRQQGADQPGNAQGGVGTGAETEAAEAVEVDVTEQNHEWNQQQDEHRTGMHRVHA